MKASVPHPKMVVKRFLLSYLFISFDNIPPVFLCAPPQSSACTLHFALQTGFVQRAVAPCKRGGFRGAASSGSMGGGQQPQRIAAEGKRVAHHVDGLEDNKKAVRDLVQLQPLLSSVDLLPGRFPLEDAIPPGAVAHAWRL